jgi:hypothetical protein
MGGARIDRVGQVFWRLTIIAAAPNEGSKRLWLCRCDCGTERIVNYRDLYKGDVRTCGNHKTIAEDLTGQRFARLTVLRRAPKLPKEYAPRWDCLCDCGERTIVVASSLKAGNTRSCGCLKRNRVDVAGRRYGRLVAIERVALTKNRSWTWRCLCDCGAEVVVSLAVLRNGRKSCGCIAREIHDAKYTPGRRGSQGSFIAMKKRCLNPLDSSFPNYGGRGVTICARWLSCFENFFADMGERPEGTTLDRIDVYGNYEPSNCRWATDDVQQANRRLFTPVNRVDSLRRQLAVANEVIRVLADSSSKSLAS